MTPEQTASEQDTDDRPRVQTTKRIDLDRLSVEVGAPLSAGDGVVVAAKRGDITQAQLEKAIAAHVPPAEPASVEPLTDDEITRLRAMLASR